MTKDTMIGVDLAKSVFQIHGASMDGTVKFRKKLSRPQFLNFMSKQALLSLQWRRAAVLIFGRVS
jgi:hypothetical protein